jgi:hypothetical protein
VTEIKYDREAETLPDKNGNPVRVGDFVMTEQGIWRVRELRPVEEHEPGGVLKKTGNLSLQYSHIDIDHPADADYLSRFIEGMTFEPVTQWSTGPLKCERVDNPDLVRQYEQMAIDQTHTVLDRVEARIAAKRRELKRREEALKLG